MISKEKEAADAKDEWSSEASVTKDPYYPYNQEWFGHDEEELMIQQKTDSPICLACTTAKMLQCLPSGEVLIIVSHHCPMQMMMF